MLEILAGRRAAFPPSLYQALSMYRHQVFVQRLGWDLPCASSVCEQDEFDTDRSVYVMARNERNEVVGCCRLLPTTEPYLLHRLLAPMVTSLALPAAPSVWELSRFAACPVDPAQRRLHAARLPRLLFDAALSEARKLGASRVIGVLSPPAERAFRRFGAPIEKLADLESAGGERFIVCQARATSVTDSLAREARFAARHRALSAASIS